jgi:hypothetical protein
MGTIIMKINSIERQRLIKLIQEEFNSKWPFLKIDYVRKGGGTSVLSQADSGVAEGEVDRLRAEARRLLWQEFALSDDTLVSELEILLQYEFGLSLQVLRKSGNLWMETSMTRHWTIRQQNQQGAEIAGYKQGGL